MYAKINDCRVSDYSDSTEFMKFDMIARALRKLLRRRINNQASSGTGLPNQRFFGSTVYEMTSNFKHQHAASEREGEEGNDDYDLFSDLTDMLKKTFN